MSITIIGKNSFLARALQNHENAKHWRYLSHQEALSDTSWLAGAPCVMNLALHPDMKSQNYDAAKDIDLAIAELIQKTSIHYIMASSRTVYGESDTIERPVFTEDDVPKPNTPYSRNKYMIEQNLTHILPQDHLTILRMGNIFGFEYERASFTGMALTRLKNQGVIEFDIAENSIRDFLPLNLWSNYIAKILSNPKAGLYNISSGIGITAHEFGHWIISGYGKGAIEYTEQKKSGQFILGMQKAQHDYDLVPLHKDEIQSAVTKLGQHLRAAS